MTNDDNTTFFIDIRNVGELTNIRLDSQYHKFINIPVNHIRFNLDYIRSLVQSGDYSVIYLICNSGRRSAMVYNKYFASDPDLNKITINDEVSFKYIKQVMKDNIAIIPSENNLKIHVTIPNKSKTPTSTIVILTLYGLLLLYIIIMSLFFKKTYKKDKFMLHIPFNALRDIRL